MGMAVVLSHIIFVGANPRFQMGCQTHRSRYLQSSLLTLDAPLGIVPTEAASIDVHPCEATKVPKREALPTVLEMDNSEAGEHLSTAEVGPSNVPNSFARITGEINEPDVSGGNKGLHFFLAR